MLNANYGVIVRVKAGESKTNRKKNIILTHHHQHGVSKKMKFILQNDVHLFVRYVHKLTFLFSSQLVCALNFIK